jgi:hypothetical protein
MPTKFCNLYLCLLLLLLLQAAYANGIVYVAKTETNVGTNPTQLNSIYWARLTPGNLCSTGNGEAVGVCLRLCGVRGDRMGSGFGGGWCLGGDRM